jgi:hypothetical protein
MKETSNVQMQQEGAGIARGKKGKTATKLEPIDHLCKATPSPDILESSHHAARREGGGKMSYCFWCKTKGHAIC